MSTYIHITTYLSQFLTLFAESLAGVLGQCTALAHLDLSWNEIETGGAESLAGVLGQCAALAHLDLSYDSLEESRHKSSGFSRLCMTSIWLNIQLPLHGAIKSFSVQHDLQS
jgi:hypothetical protein